jgi:hypothetical protein
VRTVIVLPPINPLIVPGETWAAFASCAADKPRRFIWASSFAPSIAMWDSCLLAIGDALD